jgi:hypothetical protein
MAGSSGKGHDFLRTIAAFGQANAPASSANKPIKMGRVDYDYAPSDFLGGVMPRVLFDGEKTVSQKRYQVVAGYYPQPGHRVCLIPVGTTYLIIGSVDSVQQDPVVSYFTESDTWEKPGGSRMIRVQVQGGGGAGGGCVATASGAVCAGGGGAGGAYGESWLSANSVTSSVVVTVGSAGVGGTGTGGSGTTSSFGAYVSASGGPGGGSTGSVGTNAGISGGTTTSQVIVADLSINGSGGAGGAAASGAVSMGGAGGSSHLGGGGRGVAAAGALVTGTNAAGYGGGGGGAASGTSNNASTTGGNGSPGIVIVTTFF